MPWSPTSQWWVSCKIQSGGFLLTQEHLKDPYGIAVSCERLCRKRWDVVLKKELVKSVNEVENAQSFCAASYMWKDIADFVWPILKVWLTRYLKYGLSSLWCGFDIVYEKLFRNPCSWRCISRARASEYGSSVLKWEEAHAKMMFHQFENNSALASLRNKWISWCTLILYPKGLELGLQILFS